MLIVVVLLCVNFFCFSFYEISGTKKKISVELVEVHGPDPDPGGSFTQGSCDPRAAFFVPYVLLVGVVLCVIVFWFF